MRYLANAREHLHIGLEETDDGNRSVVFNTVLLADERDRILCD